MYDKASLALIPSGYKGGSVNKVYSVLPSNGDGDFYHSRSSIATRVNKDGLIESVGYAPRLDYTGNVDCPHLLLEPNRTNIIPYSEDFSNSAWTKERATINANTSTSPDGSVNASKLIEDTQSGVHSIFEGVAVSNNIYTFSCFVKKSERDYCFLQIVTNLGRYTAVFDLVNGVVTDTQTVSSPTNTSNKIEDYGSGWYRVSVTSSNTASTTGYFQVGLSNSATPSYGSFKQPTYTGDGSSSIQIWGAQVEAGDYATSYIPTSGETSGVTRSADICNDAGTSAEFNDSEGVLFAEVEFLDNATTGYISVSDGTADNRCIIYSAANQIVVATKSGGSGISKSATGTPTNLNKIAVAYSSSGSKFFLNGSNETGTGSFSTTPRVFAANTLDQINFDISDGSNDLYARVKQVIYFNEALSDSELQTLTS